MTRRRADKEKDAGGTTNKVRDSSRRFARAAAEKTPRPYVLKLFVTGSSARSNRAIDNVRKVCEEHIPGQYKLEVVDVYQQPVLAVTEQIIASPTLIRKLPLPLRRIIGDLSDETKVLMGLGIIGGGLGIATG